MNSKNLLFSIALFSSIISFSQDKVWSLEECISYALENNIQVQQNEISQKISEQNYAASRYNTLPTLNGFASHTYNFGQTIDPFTNQFANSQVRSNNFNLSSRFTIFDGFRNINSIKRNEAQLEVAKYDLEKIKNDISLNIANAYLQILFNNELLRNAENQLRVTKIQIDRIDKQVQAGSLPEGALKDIEAQLASEDLQKINAQNQLKLSKLNLSQLLRLPSEEALEVISPNLNNFQSVSQLISPSALYATALQKMPEIKSAEYNFLSAEKSRDIAKAGYSPTLTLSGSVGTGFSGANRERVSLTDLGLLPNGDVTSSGDEVLTRVSIPQFQDKPFIDQLDDNLNQSVGFQLNIPIFNGMSSRTNLQIAKLQVQNAELQLENTKLLLRQNIESAHNDAVAALNRYNAAEKSVNALQTSFNYTEQRFKVGLLNSFQFNTEKNRLTNAQSELLQAKYNYIFSTKVLDFYQGRAITLTN